MLCPSCGKDVGNAVRLCSECEAQRLAEAEVVAQEIASGVRRPEHIAESPDNRHEFSADQVSDAGFFLRALAFWFDGAVLAIIEFATIRPLLGSYTRKVDEGLALVAQNGRMALSPSVLNEVLAACAVYLSAWVFLMWLYYVPLEGSRVGASLGKLLVGIAVVDGEYRTVSIARATARFVGKVLSYATLGIGFLLAGVTHRKQAMHDFLSGCYVIRRGPVSILRILLTLVGSFALSMVVGVLTKQNPAKAPLNPTPVVPFEAPLGDSPTDADSAVPSDAVTPMPGLADPKSVTPDGVPAAVASPTAIVGDARPVVDAFYKECVVTFDKAYTREKYITANLDTMKRIQKASLERLSARALQIPGLTFQTNAVDGAIDLTVTVGSIKRTGSWSPMKRL